MGKCMPFLARKSHADRDLRTEILSYPGLVSEGWAHYAMDLLLYQWQECAANFQRHGIYCT